MIIDDKEIERLNKSGVAVFTDDGKAVVKHLKAISDTLKSQGDTLKVHSDTLKKILNKPTPKFPDIKFPEQPKIDVYPTPVTVEPKIDVQPPKVTVNIPPDRKKEPIKKWLFEVTREFDGRIKTVTATAIE